MKVKIEVTSFLNNLRPLDDQYTAQVEAKTPNGLKVVTFTRTHTKF